MKYFIVHAFTDRIFGGNPAGVCLLEGTWPPAQLMQRLARENNLPETAFILKQADGWHIRWFTPAFEMDLCGHATLASGFVVLKHAEPGAHRVDFHSPSGPLAVEGRGERYVLDLPARPPVPVATPDGLARALGAPVRRCLAARDLIIELESPRAVAELSPDFQALGRIEGYMGFVPTARTDSARWGCDFVSRFFDPHDAIIEDPVTGSAHCSLVPFWAEALGRRELVARQLSQRGGILWCSLESDRVGLAGQAVLYLEGRLDLATC